MNWRQLFLAQHYAPTRKERIKARNKIDAERARLAELGGSHLLDFTLEYCKMPELEDNVPVPENTGWSEVPENNGKAAEPEKPKRRGRPRKNKATEEATPAAPEKGKSAPKSTLENAIKFVSPVETEIDEFSQYVNLSNKMAVAYNGQIAAGYPIVEELNLCPKIDKLEAALKQCGDHIIIVENENQTINVMTQKFRANIPCLDRNSLGQMVPDAPIQTGNFDVLKEAFKVCAALASENAERVVEASLLLENETCSGTNGTALLQYWHGLNVFPPGGIVLPVSFAKAVIKTDKEIVGIGGNWNAELGALDSLTFHFSNGAWLKTQCYNDRWPSLAPILDIPSSPKTVPVGLFKAIENVTEFIENESGAVYLRPNFIYSHIDHSVGAEFKVPDLDGVNKTLNAKLVKKVAPFITSIDLTTYEDKVMFFGDKLRGAFMAMR